MGRSPNCLRTPSLLAQGLNRRSRRISYLQVVALCFPALLCQRRWFTSMNGRSRQLGVVMLGRNVKDSVYLFARRSLRFQQDRRLRALIMPINRVRAPIVLYRAVSANLVIVSSSFKRFRLSSPKGPRHEFNGNFMGPVTTGNVFVACRRSLTALAGSMTVNRTVGVISPLSI